MEGIEGGRIACARTGLARDFNLDVARRYARAGEPFSDE